jgi:very-short-patch-repair endonuclease
LRVQGSKYQRASTIASEQRGLVARSQLLDAGLSYAVIRRLEANGYLKPELPGVWVWVYRPDMPLVDETAALLAVRSPAWLDRESALEAWGALSAGTYTGPVHVLVAGTSNQRVRGVRVHRSRLLTRRDARITEGLPVVSPALALLDAAGDLTDRELERVYDHLLVKRQARELDVRAVCARHPSHRGRKRVESLLDLHGGTTLTRSEAEERMLELIGAAHLPLPRVNHRVHGYEVDFYWPEARLVVEVDGFRYHSTRRAFERDRQRDAALRSHGIAPMRFSWRQLTEEPFAVVALIAGALAAARTAPDPMAQELSMN